MKLNYTELFDVSDKHIENGSEDNIIITTVERITLMRNFKISLFM
jgi:hypothetical protein